jgi:hypothetical protein
MTRTYLQRAKQDSRRCDSGKARYRDKTEAVHALHCVKNNAERQLEDFGTSRRKESRTYRCPDCKGWHLTSQPMLARPRQLFGGVVN